MCRLHVDSAYAGVAAILPECAPFFDGLGLVDSFSTNAHKWLLTNFDCSLLFVQDSFHLKKALTLNPSFLQNNTNEFDYKVRQPKDPLPPSAVWWSPQTLICQCVLAVTFPSLMGSFFEKQVG